MPALDFTEIATAAGGADRDQFELFAREFLELVGFRTIVGPDRGPDAGRDMVMGEARTGVAGESRVKWLVSCKHKAHSGAAVSPADESNIRDRLGTHGCDGFLGFYSTIPSSGLAATFNAAAMFEVQIYDAERIETQLLATPEGSMLAERFFPVSWAKWSKEHPRPADLLFRDGPSLSCAYCHKNLLEPELHGIVVTWTTYPESIENFKERTEHVYWCCQGACDHALEARYHRREIISGWKSLSDLVIPMEFIRWICASFNEFRDGMTYSDQAFQDIKELIINVFPLVCRDMTQVEKERVKSLSTLPSYLGGWGYDG